MPRGTENPLASYAGSSSCSCSCSCSCIRFRLHAEPSAEKRSHQIQRFPGFRQLIVIPEGMGQCLKNDQLRSGPGAQKGAMQDGSPAEQKVASARNEQGGRKAAQV